MGARLARVAAERALGNRRRARERIDAPARIRAQRARAPLAFFRSEMSWRSTLTMLLALALAACASVLGLKRTDPSRPFEHSQHVLHGIACTQCHAGIAASTHEGPTHEPTSTQCRSCHQKPHDNHECNTCHGESSTRQEAELVHT